jgi:hypothetical protein
MTFLSGAALWLMGLAGVVTVVYFLKRQAKTQLVSTLFLWKGIERRPKSALRLRWTQLLLLIIQLFALTAIVTGMAQPVIFTPSSGVGKLAIIIDSSGSMRAELSSEATTRYLKGVEVAYEVLSANPAAETMVIQAQAKSEILTPPTSDHGSIRRSLNDSEPSFQGNADLNHLFSLLQSQSIRNFEYIVYITDEMPEINVALYGWDLRVIEDADAQNVALTDFAIRAQPDGSGYDLYLEAFNSSDQFIGVPLRIEADGQILREEEIEFAPRESVAKTIQTSIPFATRFTATLVTAEIQDNWNEDDVRYATSPQPRPWEILWVGPENFYLDRLFEGLDQVQISRIDQWNDALVSESFDLVIVHRVSVPKPQAGRYLLIGGSIGEQIVWEGSSTLLTNEPVIAEVDHDILRNLDPTGWRFLSVKEIAADPQGKVLLSLASQPLLYVYDRPGLQLAYIGAELDASNLVLSLDFPILMLRLFNWLAPRAEDLTTLNVGEEIPVYDVDGEGIELVDPAGSICEPSSSQPECGLIDQPGFFQVINSGFESAVFAANPQAEESVWKTDIDQTGQGSNTSGTPPVSGFSGALIEDLKASTSIWPYLLALGSILMFLELLIFERSFFSLNKLFKRSSR